MTQNKKKNINILSRVHSTDWKSALILGGERNVDNVQDYAALQSGAERSSKQPRKLSQLQNTQLNLLTVTFPAI